MKITFINQENSLPKIRISSTAIKIAKVEDTIFLIPRATITVDEKEIINTLLSLNYIKPTELGTIDFVKTIYKVSSSTDILFA